MNTTNIPITRIENNTGQVPGLPPNPRITNPAKLEKLVESIKQDPEMLQLRGLLVYPIEGGKYITIGGNMRLQALNRLGYTDVPCIIIPQDTPVDKLRNYIIKDNGDFGDWDYQALTASWDTLELQEWAIDIPEFEAPQEEKKRAGWNTQRLHLLASQTRLFLCVMFQEKRTRLSAFTNQGGFLKCAPVR